MPKDVTSLQVSPDGKWLYAWAKADPKITEQDTLWITATAAQGGSAWRRIDFGTSPGSWHPDSQRFAFSSYVKSLPTVKVVQLPGFDVKNLEGKGYILDQPSWSPDGKSLIAYGTNLTAKGEYGTTDIYGLPVADYLAILNMRGRIRRKIKTRDLAIALKLSALNWSPDSKRVSYAAFYSLSSGPGLNVIEIASEKDTYLPHIMGFTEVPAPWLNEKWLLLNLPDYKYNHDSLSGGGGTSTFPAERNYFGEKAGGNSGYIQAYRLICGEKTPCFMSCSITTRTVCCGAAK